MISGLFAAGGLGRITGSLLGGAAWLWGGIAANSTISAIACSLAFGIIVWVIRQWKRTSSK